MMRRFYKFLFLLSLLLLVTGPALAKADDASTITGTVKQKEQAAQAALADFKAARAEDRLAKLKVLGDKLVDSRTDAITKQTTRLTSGKCAKIDATAQTAIKAGLDGVKTQLATEKTQLDAATDLDTAKGLIKDIIQTNRVFRFLIPASNGACLAQRIISLIDGKLTTAVTKLTDADLDTAAITTKLAEAKTAAQSAYDNYLVVINNPGGDDTGNKAKMEAAKTFLQTARKALGDIKSDIGNLTGQYQDKTNTAVPPATTTPTL